MNFLGMTLLFDPPGQLKWLLWSAASLALLWEVVSLLHWVWNNRRPSFAISLTLVALLTGMAGAVIALIYGAMAGTSERTRAMVRAGLWGTLIHFAACLVFFLPDGGAILAIMTCALAWVFRAYRRTTSPLRRPLKALLLTLRIIVLLLLAAWSVRPAIERVTHEKVRRWLLIAVDDSASMNRRDMPAVYTDKKLREGEEPVSRVSSVRDALNDNRRQIEQLIRQNDIDVFTFDGEVIRSAELTGKDPEAPFPALTASGQVTAIGDVIARRTDLHTANARDVGAILLISDGCNNTSDIFTPERLAEIKGSQGIGIYTIGVGSQTVTGSTRTLTVKNLGAEDEVQAFNKLPITATIEAIGLDTPGIRAVKVICRFGEQVIGKKEIEIRDRQVSRTVRFVHVPLLPGYHRLRVSAEIVGKKPRDLAGKPSEGKLVRVVDRDMRILYVEGKFRFESKYIARAFAGGRRFRLDRRVLLQPLRVDSPPPIGDKLADWMTYHAVIFGDVSASQFTNEQLEIVRKLVGEYGKGFCMIGGRNSFGRGGWDKTPIAKMMPVDLGASKGQRDEMIRVIPTRDGLANEIMNIAVNGKNAETWASLRKLSGCNLLAGVKPAATVLAETSDRKPLIVAQRYGKGRTLAIAFDTTWRWVLSQKDTAEAQRRFLRQVGLYLTAPKGNVWIVTDRTSYDHRRLVTGAESIRIEAGVEDASGRSMSKTPVKVSLFRPSDTKRQSPIPLALSSDKMMRQGMLSARMATEAGVYTLRIEASVDGKNLSAEHRFEVLKRDLEAMDVLAKFDVLKQISEASGGEFAPIASLSEMIGKIRIAARPKIVPIPHRQELTRDLAIPLIIVLIALLCVEWSVRKRKGLV